MIGKNRVRKTAQELAEAKKDKGSKALAAGAKIDDSVMEVSISPEAVQHAQNAADIREHMPVIASCGKRVGTVEAVEDDSIKVKKGAVGASAKPRYIPTDWVDGVEDCVHLNKSSQQVEAGASDKPIGAGD